MKFKLLGDWPASAALIESGTIIDLADAKWDWLPLPLPMNAQALDQSGYDHLAEAYGPEYLNKIHYAAGITPVSAADFPLWLTAQREKDLA